MALIPWRPFHDLDRFFEDEDWFLPIVPRWKVTEPTMDLYETEKDVVAEMEVPDIDPAKIDIEVEGDVLRVSGKTEEKKEEKEKNYWRREIRRGAFERMVRLPAAVHKDKIDATYEKGLLKIVMQKEEAKLKTKKIPVKEKK